MIFVNRDSCSTFPWQLAGYWRVAGSNLGPPGKILPQVVVKYKKKISSQNNASSWHWFARCYSQKIPRVRDFLGVCTKVNVVFNRGPIIDSWYLTRMECLDRTSSFWWSHLWTPVLHSWRTPVFKPEPCEAVLHSWGPACCSYTRTELPIQPLPIDLNLY